MRTYAFSVGLGKRICHALQRLAGTQIQVKLGVASAIPGQLFFFALISERVLQRSVPSITRSIYRVCTVCKGTSKLTCTRLCSEAILN